MTKELRIKMQQMSAGYADDDRRVTRSEYTAYLAGAEAMHAELATIVEWVSVKDNPIPNDIEDFLIKLENGSIYRFAENWEDEFQQVTHWRRI